MTGGGLPREGLKWDLPPGPLHELPHAGHNSGLGGGELSPPVVPTVWPFCLMGGIE